jgi:hypothetical protein
MYPKKEHSNVGIQFISSKFTAMKKAYIIFPSLLFILASGFTYDYFQSTARETALHDFTYKGMNLVAPIEQIDKSTFAELKANHVNAISLIPYAFVNTDKATVQYNKEKQWWGERPEGIIECNQLAKNQGMTVMLKPHLWISHEFYTGNLDFPTTAKWKKWETAYENYILEFAELAEKEHIALFCFGTELGNAVQKRPEYWQQLIVKIKKVYHGKLTYAANWDDYDKVPFWKELDYIGIDAYFPLSEEANPSVAELNLAWQKHLGKMEVTSKRFGKKVLFTEFGYRNSAYATQAPWTEKNNERNEDAQANAYEALFQSLSNKTWFDGGFAWKWYADGYFKEDKNRVDYTPQGKPALLSLKKGYH